MLDPVADRLAIAAGLIAMIVRGALPLWAGLAVIVRDVAVLVVGAVVAGRPRGPGGRPVPRQDRDRSPDDRHHVDRVGQPRPAARRGRARGGLGRCSRSASSESYVAAALVPGRHPSRRRDRDPTPHVSAAESERRGRRHRRDRAHRASEEETVEYPDDVRYTRQHEWARDGGRPRPDRHHRLRAGRARRRRLRRPSGGRHRRHGGPAVRRGRVDEVRLRRLRARSAGTVVERNPLLDERPELVNEQPYGDGWLVVVEPADPSRSTG